MVKLKIVIVLLCALSYIITSKELSQTYLLFGETGSGKSSLVNMMNNGKQIAKEGETYESQTIKATLYGSNVAPNIKFIDTPGIFDTTGFTNDEIVDLIRTTMVSESIDTINGVLLVIDPTQTKIRLKSLFEGIITMFGKKILNNVYIIANKNSQIDSNRRKLLKEYAEETLVPIYKNFNDVSDSQVNRIIDNMLIFLDTKKNNDGTVLKNRLNTIGKQQPTNNYVKIYNNEEINAQITNYYNKELVLDSNYKIWTDEVVHNEPKKRRKQEDKIVHYTERCNPRRYCSDRFMGICIDHDTAWSTCPRQRTEKVWIEEEYIDTWVEKIPRKELKYSKDHLWEKSKTNMINDIKSKIYNAWNQRTMKNEL